MPLVARRCVDHPIVSPDTPGYRELPGETPGNINGPSLIRVPDWVGAPLGRYYLYFANHKGMTIRLAFADALTGPWQISDEPPMTLEQTPLDHHIASPDLHIDHARRRLVMYYHGVNKVRFPKGPAWDQPSFVATSTDGLHWTTDTTPIGESYFRVFRHGDWTYAVAKAGRVYRSRDGFTNFEERPERLDELGRHWAVHMAGETAHLFYSRWGDCPEHILHAAMPLTADWTAWRLPRPVSLLKPERSWEGVDLPIAPSENGMAREPVHELRDPAIFSDDDGRRYLVYSTAGEAGLGLAELTGLP